MSVRQAKCQYCNLPTGESYDDENPTPIQSLCPGCRAASRARGEDAPIDPGTWTPGVSRTPEIQTHDGDGRYACPDCGGHEFEIEMAYTEYASATAMTDEMDGSDYLWFDSPTTEGYGEWNPESGPFCRNCGASHRGDYEIG